jgi:MoaA/NifB/PqqE/SkfB family radical SAM enzyme
MTLCILPWINFGTNTFGRARACGYSDLKSNNKLKNSSIADEWNGEYFTTIRKAFINNTWPANCKRCKYVESLDGTSKRMDENVMWMQQYSQLINDTNADGSVNYPPPHIDIRTGTICNLKCIHCGTGASSKWQEDTSLINKYANTENYTIDNKWVEQDAAFWDHLRTLIPQIRRYNFLGGESFANKQHNLFLEDLAKSEYAKDVSVAYVSNGTLIHAKRLDQLSNFKSVKITISIDAVGKSAEYFRFPLKWDNFTEKLTMLANYISDKPQFDVGLQWTCSNISMFYLTETYDFFKKEFPSLKFIFCNHVEWPAHMSACTLPKAIKLGISARIKDYNWGGETAHKFYVNHMMSQDSWELEGETFMKYLRDIDSARAIQLEEYMPALVVALKQHTQFI